MIQRLSGVLGILVSVLSINAFAESANTVSGVRKQNANAVRLKGKPRTAARTVASADYGQIRASAPTRRGRGKTVELQVGIASGFATSNTNVTSDQQDRDAARFNNNIYMGINADVRFLKYLGAEADGYLNLAPQRLSTTRSSINGTTTSQDKSLQQYGGSTAVKGQYALRVSRITFTPKIGLGYGLVGLKQSSVSESNEVTNLYTHGMFGLTGIDVSPLPGFWISTDYAISLIGDGELERSVTGANKVETELMRAKFDRFRVGAFVKISDPFVIGAQFVTRRVQYQPTGETQNFEERMNQFLGLVMVGF